MSIYFGRVYRLEVRTTDGLVRTFDGFPSEDNVPLNIDFRIDQTPNSERSYGVITLYGVSQQNREDIYERFGSIRLTAGYTQEYATIFQGSIENTELGQEGPDVFIRFYCQSGAGNWEGARVNRSFGADTPQREIIESVAQEFGFPVDFEGDFDSLPAALRGKTLSGDAKAAMRQLARSFGFAWFLQNERLRIVKDGHQPAGEVWRYNPTNGLVGTPQVTQRGVDVTVLLNPRIRPYDQYTVESQTQALTFNGIYYQTQQFPGTNGRSRNQVISLSHQGSFFGDQWETTIEGRRL